jgi:RNA polymerase sigma-54 factor
MTINTNLSQKFKLQQKLTLSLQQAVHVLQLPIVELASWVQLQIEENPLLHQEYNPPAEIDCDRSGFEVLEELDENFVQAVFPEYPEELPSLENLIPSSPSLYHHLMEQAKAAFPDPIDLYMAEQIIGHLDFQGFLGDFKANGDILAKIQTFDPPGIAARNLQECLLIQLKEKSLAFRLIKDHFDDLLHARWSLLTQKLSLTETEIQLILRQEISPLNFHPASKFCPPSSHFMIPDIVIDSNETIHINEEPLPQFTVQTSPCSDMDRYYTAGKWMEKILSRRRQILTQIMHSLIQKHPDFFQGATTVSHPLTLQQMAHELGLHHSTIARAVKDKYVACPQGIFPLRHFFPHTLTKNDTVSHLSAKKLLQELIKNEDKKKPLSDSALMRLMQEAGIPCARRTVAKYRHLLQIPTASLRRK